ncbi:MAG: DUF1902 domain-containing protein [gamma proteobacterium symbiont of Bathyaustriella thionipta]|nr:DUF1902 domain-containing protein [gamma proteobacterium symbiont of Bathyaustriella thionipta]
MTIEVQANYDQEAKVFVATSRDLPGLVLEANGIDELKCELGEAIPALLKIDHKKPLRNTSADLCYRDHIAIA